MSKEVTVLFLYTRLPDYFYQCALHFVKHYEASIVIVRHEGDANTKYSFKPHESIRLVYKNDISLETFIKIVSPDAIIISGWSDKDYTRAAKPYRMKIPVVLSLDNPWFGTLRQMLLASASFVIRQTFNTAWVAGRSQYEYASRLGFGERRIFNNLYCADTGKFYEVWEESRRLKSKAYPKRLVYLGRLVEYKQPHLLAETFNELVSAENYSWTLIIAGEGPLKRQIAEKNYAHVCVEDFVLPERMVGFYREAGAFCLPSIHEHWGLAVQEAAAAGLPLLLSDTVQSGSEFLIDHYNGYAFATGEKESLKRGLRNLMRLDEERLLRMSDNSVELSRRISHSHWSGQLNSILKADSDE